MNVVVDTNVLVAGLLSPFGPPGEIVRMIASGAVCVCIDARILTEYADVLSRAKFTLRQNTFMPCSNRSEWMDSAWQALLSRVGFLIALMSRFWKQQSPVTPPA